MIRVVVALVGLLALASVVGSCSREDGLPDPPVRMLVPCDPAAAPGDPLACPPDAAVPVDGGSDGD